MALNDIGDLLYGPSVTGTIKAFRFDKFTRTHLNGRPLQDEARRTVKFVQWTLEVDARVSWVNASGGTFISPDRPGDIVSFRERLSKQGQQLKYAGKGFDNSSNDPFTVNAPDGPYDSMYGPIPEVLDIKWLGGSNAALVSWRVSFCIPECHATAKYAGPFAFAAFNYEKTWVIEQGYTTIETRGYLEIPLTRRIKQNGVETIQDRADYYRELVRSDNGPPLGFDRTTPQTFHESADKRVLHFYWTDREMPAPLPEGVVACDAQQTLSDSFPKWSLWHGTISATMVLNNKLPKAYALDKFLLIVKSRLSFDQVGVFKGTVQGQDACGWLTAVRIRDSIFGRDTTLEVDYFFGGVNVEAIIGLTGMWQPITGLTPVLWRNSMGAVMDVRGTAGVAEKLDEDKQDAMLDLCNQGQPLVKTYSNIVDLPQDERELKAVINLVRLWLTYENRVYLKTETGQCRHKPLNNQAILKTVGYDAGGSADQFGNDSGIGKSTILARDPDKVQLRSTPNAAVVMEGYAVRLGMRVPIPELKTFGGQECKEFYRDTGDEMTSNFCGIPVYWAAWYIEYELEKPPEERVLVAANPVLRNDAITGQGNQVVTLTAQPL